MIDWHSFLVGVAFGLVLSLALLRAIAWLLRWRRNRRWTLRGEPLRNMAMACGVMPRPGERDRDLRRRILQKWVVKP